MKLLIITKNISGNYIEVFKKFDRELFRYLLPKFPPSKIITFEGCQKGHNVRLQVGPFTWESLITYDGINNQEALFIDEGIILPSPLKQWKHQHIIRKVGDNSCDIIDDIEFSTGAKLMDRLIYPFLKYQFGSRKDLYRKYFNE